MYGETIKPLVWFGMVVWFDPKYFMCICRYPGSGLQQHSPYLDYYTRSCPPWGNMYADNEIARDYEITRFLRKLLLWVIWL